MPAIKKPDLTPGRTVTNQTAWQKLTGPGKADSDWGFGGSVTPRADGIEDQATEMKAGIFCLFINVRGFAIGPIAELRFERRENRSR